MSKLPLNLTRNQIAAIVGDNPRAVRAFELLIQQVNDLLPSDVATLNRLIQEAATDAGIADSKATQANDNLARIADALEMIAAAPREELGTMAPMNKAFMDFIGFNQLAAPALQPGQIGWNSADGCLDVKMGYDDVTLQVGMEQYFRIKASSPITNGDCVMFTGSVGASGVLTGAPSAIGLTQGQYIMGVATMDMALNAFGYVTCFGLVRGINTTGASVGETWADGDILYYNPAYVGGLTKVRPTSPNAVIILASVVNAGSGGSGSLFIRPTFYPKLYELSDVFALGAVDGDKLIYNGTTGRWEKDSRSYLMLE